MRRRDFGKLAVGAVGVAAVGTSNLRPAQAATKVKGTGYKIASKKAADNKFYLLSEGTISIKAGQQIQFVYMGVVNGKPTFEFVDVGAAGKGALFSIVINGTPSTGLDASPSDAVIVDSTGSVPIEVQQPGG